MGERRLDVGQVRRPKEAGGDARDRPSGTSRRRVLKGALALSATGVLSSLAAPSLAKGATLTVSTWGGYTQDLIKNQVQPDFERMTSAKIEYDIGSQGARYNKLLAQRNSPPADIFFSTDDQIIAGIRAGVVQPVERSSVASLSQLFDWAIVGGNVVPAGTFAGAAYGLIAYVIGFNPETVKNKPTSWSDLWRPEFLNKLAFFSPFHSQLPALIITTAEMFGGSADKPDVAFKKMAELRPSRLGFTWTDWAAAFKTGDVSAATEADFYMNVMKKEGYPIEWIVPKEKGFACLQSASVVNGTKEPELAHMFLNLLLDAKAQHVFAAELLQGTTNKTITLTPEQKVNCTCGAEVEQLRFFDPVQIAAVRPAWTERINIEVVPSWGKR